MDEAFELAEFDRYVEEAGISDEEYPAAFARWVNEHTGDSEQPGRGLERSASNGRGDTPK
jgi:hypothetical protein